MNETKEPLTLETETLLDKMGFKLEPADPEAPADDLVLRVNCEWTPADGSPIRIKAAVDIPREMMADMDEDPKQITFYLPGILGAVEKFTGVQYDDDTIKALAHFLGLLFNSELARRRAGSAAA